MSSEDEDKIRLQQRKGLLGRDSSALLDYITKYRSSHTEVFRKKGFLKNFSKFTGKHLCQSLLFNKAAG